MRNKGFTLIELLVVIAIIALLMSIIVPALRTAKLQAAAAVCLANVNGLSKAWMLYSQDNHDNLVGSCTKLPGPNDYSWATWPKRDQNDNLAAPMAHNATTKENEIFGFQAGLLFKYIESPESYHCPMDKRYLKPFGTGTLGYRTYGISSGIGAASDAEINYLGYYPHTKMTTIKTPGSKFIFLEEGEEQRGFNLNSWVFKPQLNNVLTDSLGFFHGDRSIIGYADGHAEKHIWKDKDIIDRSKAGAAGDFVVSDAASLDLAFLKQGFTYLRLR
jgi:prepilin-type N-terminal cleavage/methylation domain-containing protein/prepilin-type processing-associated H-X9-DG protein